MKAVDTKQQLSALTAAVGITFSIVWALSGYAYSATSSAEVSPTAARIAHVRRARSTLSDSGCRGRASSEPKHVAMNG